MKTKDFDELGNECVNLLIALNPKGGIKAFIRMAVEFGYKRAVKDLTKPVVKKLKKHEIILNELKRKRKANKLFCDMNNCEPTDYTRGQNIVLDEMIKFVEDLNDNEKLMEANRKTIKILKEKAIKTLLRSYGHQYYKAVAFYQMDKEKHKKDYPIMLEENDVKYIGLVNELIDHAIKEQFSINEKLMQGDGFK